MELLGILVLVAIVFIILQAAKVLEQQKAMRDKVAGLSDFSATQFVAGIDGLTGLAVDEGRGLVCLIKKTADDFDLCVIEYGDVLSAEIYEDGQSVEKTSRLSQAGGMLVGGLLLGGVGAVVGGLSGRKVVSAKPRQVDLRVVVNRTTEPTHDVVFMNVEADSGGALHQAVMKNVRHWHGLLAVAIRRADEDGEAESAGKRRPSGSVADELAKLADLRAKGLLSEDEWVTQKRRLLGQ